MSIDTFFLVRRTHAAYEKQVFQSNLKVSYFIVIQMFLTNSNIRYISRDAENVHIFFYIIKNSVMRNFNLSLNYLLVRIELTCMHLLAPWVQWMTGTDSRNIPLRCIQCLDISPYCIHLWAGKDTNSTNLFNCYVCVRQGEKLSSFLFSLNISDLKDNLFNENATGLPTITEEIKKNNNLFSYLKMFNILFYADDTVILVYKWFTYSLL